MPHMQIILKYIGQEYGKFKILGDYFNKTMIRINSEQLTFYIPQIFQSLEYDFAPSIEKFFLTYCKRSPLFAHKLIWLSRVESRIDGGEDPKINEKKRKYADSLPNKIIRNMDMLEKTFWEDEDRFFEDITNISTMLWPAMPPSEKKERIDAELTKILPPKTSVLYLPTNPHYRVISIMLGSGAPMQSAAKCPIRVTFECELFDGPDKWMEQMKEEQKNKQSDFGVDFDMWDVNENVHNDKMEPSMYGGINTGKYAPGGSQNFGQSDGAVGGEMKLQRDYSKKLASDLDSVLRNLDPRIQTSRFQAGNGELVRAGSLEGVFEDDQQLKQGPGNGFLPSKKKLQINDDMELKKIKRGSGNGRKLVSCIFKTMDDIRQDFVALQIIRAFEEIFKKIGLDVFVAPYKTIPTRTGEKHNIGGIIEVIPDTASRDQIGKANAYGLYEYFHEKFGPDLSPVFQYARENFIKSMAAYAVVCYILQIKDRHNGNILIDGSGH